MNDTLRIANDTLRIANDSLKVVQSSTNETQIPSATIREDIIYLLCVIVILAFIAAGFYFTVRIILASIERSREKSLKHEEIMHDLNRIQEERKRLLDFCYMMAQKKEGDTKESEKQSEKNIPKLMRDKVYDALDAALNKEGNNNPTKDETSENSDVSHKNKDTQYISLDQIRQECWIIIKEYKS